MFEQMNPRVGGESIKFWGVSRFLVATYIYIYIYLGSWKVHGWIENMKTEFYIEIELFTECRMEA